MTAKKGFVSVEAWLFICFVWILALLVFGSLKGCSTLGYDQAEVNTTRKGILIATAELRAANLLLQDLIARRSITREQAQDAKNALQDAHDILQSALDAVSIGGDPATATDSLQRVDRILSTVLLFLAPFTEGADNEDISGKRYRDPEHIERGTALAHFTRSRTREGATAFAAGNGGRARFDDGGSSSGTG